MGRPRLWGVGSGAPPPEEGCPLPCKPSLEVPQSFLKGQSLANRRVQLAPHRKLRSAVNQGGRILLLSFSLVNCATAFLHNQPVSRMTGNGRSRLDITKPSPSALIAWANFRQRVCRFDSKPWRRPNDKHQLWPCTRLAGSSTGSANAALEETEGNNIPQYDLPGLKKEITRQVQRQFKKVGKAEEKLRKAEAQYTELDPETEEGLFKEAEIIELKEAAAVAVDRLKRLNTLEENIKNVKSVNNEKYPEIAKEALALELSDEAPERPPRPEKKPKGPKPTPRKPYVKYTSADGIEIWVGRGAADNDQLSLKLRDARDWWMHVSGHPGSHVVIRCQEENPPKETMLDAAALALKFSQAGGGTQPVSVCRCRDVKKPSGLNPGQVQLTGPVSTIKTNLKAEAARLERLLETRSTD